MTGLKNLALLALGWTASAEQVKRQDATAKYCPGGTPICFSEYTVAAQNLIYRIAIPDVAAAPFDILLQIVAPKTIGWAGIAWGGKMSNNPLTIGWASGTSAVVSSRWTSGHSMPGAYTGANYIVLPTTTSNATHWQLDVLCQGCSQWAGGSLNPNGQNAFAWAKSNRAVSAPANNASSFGSHDGKAVFAHDLSQAKIPKGVFDAVAYDLQDGTPATPSSAVAVPPVVSSVVVVPSPVVATSVVTLPRPVSSVVESASAPPVIIFTTRSSRPVAVTPTAIPTRLTALPSPVSSSRPVIVVTSVTQLPRPSTSTVFVIPKPSSTSTVLVLPPPKPSTTVVTVIVTAKPPATPTPTPAQPPAGGGPPWWGGKGKGKGRPPGRGGRPGTEEEK